MTRINCVPPSELSREHLVAEYRELPRIFKSAAYAWDYGWNLDREVPTYRLGEGHLRFFWSRLGYCAARHRELVKEMERRGYVTNLVDVDVKWRDMIPEAAWGDWVPDAEAQALSRGRILERTPG